MAAFKIAIIGAGPGGCTLARILLHSPSKVHVTIFEAEASLNFRSQGGTLDLQDITGLKAIREAGLYDDFLKYARFDGEALKVTDKKLTKYVNFGGATEGSGRGSPEIDRKRLRQILFESLPDGIVRWGCRLRSIDSDLKLHFDHGVEENFDLVVGADGAWSKVRPLLTDDKPFYAGMSGYALTIPKATDYPDLNKLVNRGSVFSYSDGKTISAQQMGDGSFHVAGWKLGDEVERGQQTLVADGAAAKEKMRKTFHDWAPELVKFIQVADNDSITQRSLYMLPVGNRWENVPGVTLIGDAAHLMTPFAGVGVNAALVDAMDLAHAIMDAEKAGTKEALHKKVAEFEAVMFKRSQKLQELTHGNMNDMFFVEGAPRTTIENWLIRGATSRTEYTGWKLKAISCGIYVWMFFFKLFHW